MKKMFAGFGALIKYVCIGTVIAQLMLITLLYGKGALTPTKRWRIQAILSGVDMEKLRAESLSESAVRNVVRDPDDTLDGFVQGQRENQIDKGLDLVESMRSGITRERERYEIIKSDFNNRLDRMETESMESSRSILQQTLEAIKPRQAKDQIVRMINDDGIADAAVILLKMSDSSRKKIFDEFKQPGDELKLHDLVMAIRDQQRALSGDNPPPDS